MSEACSEPFPEGFPEGFPGGCQGLPRQSSVVRSPRNVGVRRCGAAALDLAYVAAGRLDGFWEIGLKPWDIAAGALLVREAGGLITDLNGGDNWYETGNILCANRKLLRHLAPAVRLPNH